MSETSLKLTYFENKYIFKLKFFNLHLYIRTELIKKLSLFRCFHIKNEILSFSL